MTENYLKMYKLKMTPSAFYLNFLSFLLVKIQK